MEESPFFDTQLWAKGFERAWFLMWDTFQATGAVSSSHIRAVPDNLEAQDLDWQPEGIMVGTTRCTCSPEWTHSLSILSLTNHVAPRTLLLSRHYQVARHMFVFMMSDATKLESSYCTRFFCPCRNPNKKSGGIGGAVHNPLKIG